MTNTLSFTAKINYSSWKFDVDSIELVSHPRWLEYHPRFFPLGKRKSRLHLVTGSCLERLAGVMQV